MRKGMNSIAGITWERLERDSCVSTRAKTKAIQVLGRIYRGVPDRDRAREIRSGRPDSRGRTARQGLSVVLITGRQLEHWHTGAMTRRASVLDAIEPEPVCSIHPLDLAALGAKAGDLITVESRRGKVSLYARIDEARRAAPCSSRSPSMSGRDVLTNPKLDPFGKIPEFKYCAVRVSKGGELPGDPGYGKGRALAEIYE